MAGTAALEMATDIEALGFYRVLEDTWAESYTIKSYSHHREYIIFFSKKRKISQ